MINQELHLYTNPQSRGLKSTRDGFGDALLEEGKQNQQIAVITADLAESTKVEAFAKMYPSRFYDVGVAEQNLAGVSGGLASTGLIPVCASYAMFQPGRSWDQIRNTICYGNMNVKIVSSHAGLTVGPDGATHQALEDIALTRSLPNLTVISPCDYEQAQQATKHMLECWGPVYLRLSRHTSLQYTSDETPYEIGKAQTLRFGNGVTIVATGQMVQEAMRAAPEIDAEVINLHTIKPLDIHTIEHSLQKTHKLIMIEEHQIAGGMGSAILEALVQNSIPIPPARLMGVNNQFGQSGTADELLAYYNLTWEHIVDVAKSF